MCGKCPTALHHRAMLLLEQWRHLVSWGPERYVVGLACKSLSGKVRERPDHMGRVMQGVKQEGFLPTRPTLFGYGGSLREAYELATLVVLPSLAETVGLPMPEAMSVGTPVLAADRAYAHD